MEHAQSSANVFRPSWVGWAFFVFYVLIFGILKLIGYPLILAIREGGLSRDNPVYLVILSVMHAVFCIFFYSYLGNSLDFRIVVATDSIEIKRPSGVERVLRSAVSRVRLLRGGRGWRYIGIYTQSGCSVITNSLYSDREFDRIAAAVGIPPSPGERNLLVEEANGPQELGSSSFRFANLPFYIAIYVGMCIAMFLTSIVMPRA